MQNANTVSTTLPNNPNDTVARLKFSSMHYVPTISENIKSIIQTSTSDVKLAFKPTKTLRQAIFSKSKQKIKKQDKPGVIYKLDCQDCDQCYIGQTSKKLKSRISRHKSDFKHRFALDSKTSLITHTLDTGHTFDYSKMSILGSQQNTFKREIMESSHILIHNQTAVNRKTDLNNLNLDYHNTLKVFASTSKLSPLKNNKHDQQHA